jgi:Helicase associated domain
LAAAWEEGFLHLKTYEECKGHCRVPARHNENGYPLGQWVGVQRANKDDLSAERRQRLDELGFVWNPFAADWEKSFLHLKTYKNREGHCFVPHAYKENGFRLGQWVNVQRTNQTYRRSADSGWTDWGLCGMCWRQLGKKASAI